MHIPRPCTVGVLWGCNDVQALGSLRLSTGLSNAGNTGPGLWKGLALEMLSNNLPGNGTKICAHRGAPQGESAEENQRARDRSLVNVRADTGREAGGSKGRTCFEKGASAEMLQLEDAVESKDREARSQHLRWVSPWG